MIHKALVIDNDPFYRDIVAKILDSLMHTYEFASSQEEAWKLIMANKYSYILMALEIPVKKRDKTPRIQNSENLLRNIVDYRGTEKEPVIIMAEHNVGTLAVRMIRMGADDFVDKMFMPFSNGLDKAILNSLKHQDRGKKQVSTYRTRRPASKPYEEKGNSQVASDRVRRSFSKPLEEFNGGEMVFYTDRVELCGITIVEKRPRMRRILDDLRVKRPGGKYATYSSSKLADKLGVVSGQNSIVATIKNFRDNVVKLFADKGIMCGQQDVILSGGPGYRLAEWITVRDSDKKSSSLPESNAHSCNSVM